MKVCGNTVYADIPNMEGVMAILFMPTYQLWRSVAILFMPTYQLWRSVAILFMLTYQLSKVCGHTVYETYQLWKVYGHTVYADIPNMEGLRPCCLCRHTN